MQRHYCMKYTLVLGNITIPQESITIYPMYWQNPNSESKCCIDFPVQCWQLTYCDKITLKGPCVLRIHKYFLNATHQGQTVRKKQCMCCSGVYTAQMGGIDTIDGIEGIAQHQYTYMQFAGTNSHSHFTHYTRVEVLCRQSPFSTGRRRISTGIGGSHG